MSFFNLPLLSFLKNGSQVPVQKDTTNPANTNPLPVELTGASGDVAVNAANLNIEVQTSGYGANPDSVRITDGTNELVINSNGSIPLDNLTFPPAVHNISIPTANLEQSFVIPGTARQIELYERSGARIKYAFVSGQSSIQYATVDPGTYKVLSGFKNSVATTLYFQATKANGTLELSIWS